MIDSKSAISLSYFKESEVVYIFFKFLMICNDIKNVFRGEAVPSREETTKYGLKYEKTVSVNNYLLKCS